MKLFKVQRGVGTDGRQEKTVGSGKEFGVAVNGKILVLLQRVIGSDPITL